MSNVAVPADAVAQSPAATPPALSRALSAVIGRLVIIVPYLWLLVFFLIPFVIVFKISLSQTAIAMPPYVPVFGFEEGIGGFLSQFGELNFDNYVWLTEDALYFNAYVSSVVIAGVSTVLALLVGYPIAYGMARAPASIRPTLLMLVILPFWTSFLIRVYAWIGILKPEGLLNQLLLGIGVIDEPLIIMNTHTAIFIGIVYSYLPFMILPLYSALEKMDYSLIEAAQDLGCTPISAFWKITFPLSLPGVIAGCMLVFIPAVGEFVIPDLLGGSQTLMIGKTLWNEFFSNRDWPVSSAVAVILLLLLIVPIMIFQSAQARAQEQGAMNTTWSRFNIVSIVLGFAFLYLPIVLLVVFSFNESKLVTVWGGFSTKWYASLFHNTGPDGRGLGHCARRRDLGDDRNRARHARRARRSPATRVFAAGCCFQAWCLRRWSCPKSSPACRCCCSSWRSASIVASSRSRSRISPSQCASSLSSCSRAS